MPKIPFWATVARSYKVVFDNVTPLVRLAVVPTIALCILAAVWPVWQAATHSIVFEHRSWTSESGAHTSISYPATATGWVIGNVWIAVLLAIGCTGLTFGMAWNRFVLLDERPGWFRILRFGRSELRGFGQILLMFVVAILFLILGWSISTELARPFTFAAARTKDLGTVVHTGYVTGLIGVGVGVVMALIAVAVYTRWSLVFPGIALRRTRVLGAAWASSARNAMRLYFGSFIVVCPVSGFAWIVQQMAAPLWQMGIAGRMAAMAVSVATGIISIALDVTFIALSYAYLAYRRPEALVCETAQTAS